MATFLTFPEFQATRTKCADLDAVFGDDGLGAGFTYADGSCYITQMRKQPAEYHLIIERSEWTGDDLERLELILWSTHYLGECTGVNLSKDDGTLDAYVQGKCAAFDVEVDGDLWGIVFSSVDTHISERAARNLMHANLVTESH